MRAAVEDVISEYCVASSQRTVPISQRHVQYPLRTLTGWPLFFGLAGAVLLIQIEVKKRRGDQPIPIDVLLKPAATVTRRRNFCSWTMVKSVWMPAVVGKQEGVVVIIEPMVYRAFMTAGAGEGCLDRGSTWDRGRGQVMLLRICLSKR